MDKQVSDEFWEALDKSPFIMMRLEQDGGHSEPMTAILDEDAHHAIWFYCGRGNRIAGGGAAMGQFASKGHDVFACIAGTISEETDRAVFDAHWSNPVQAWFPGGKNDPDVMMLRFDITDVEVWTSELGVVGTFKLITGRTIAEGEAGKHAVGAV